jgi:endonuclease/exonuclease/phosphatase family metal-dependent hydrolase
MANLVGPDAAGFLLATRDLAEQGAITYTGYWRPRFRSFIDHIVISREAADQVEAVGVYDNAWARVASDHLPVYLDLKPDPAGKDDRPGDVTFDK